MSSTRIAVTGATGHIGGSVARKLAEQNVPLRVFVRDATRLPELGDVEITEGTYTDSERVYDALQGIDVLFFVSADENADLLRTHDRFISAAMAAGVNHVVYLSFAGAMRDATCTVARDHWHTERLIRTTCRHWTFLRDNMYADTLPQLVGEDGVIRGPGRKGKIAPVAQEDIVDVAVSVLLNPHAYDHRSLELSGPQAFPWAELARLLQEESGQAISYQHTSVEETMDELLGTLEPWQACARVSHFLAAAKGELGDVTRDIERVLGRPATSAQTVLRNIYAASPALTG
ncbi:SDR family oxidoreductase [Dermatophilus congolensis]|uniref:NAD(P)H azoreductase n=1 Tax=Dermatophilus congolensis TaxID=1863 RepID=A0A239V430_9MICO|nr:SDR family oxidoreductase [Dermatophilus congolensis]MBO3130137.1 SDR family oxidoreductase [Dermatophilus congolensis]MBO3131236.1 SDR family oxidoreductase [Dermatophilus congolensis]MBO3134608.1 SDR family oxidoreductase [Dermatophilus congolensis]MBO3136845.1 SDR family oxidoreductase [Dermatophilus congolensis]MBO3139089.1 SDR family oxidoreductase [Dermatophilus congolensis]